MKAVPADKRAKIYALVQQGYPTRVVAKKQRVSQSTVSKICKRFSEKGTLQPKRRPGRPRFFSKHQENNLVRYIATGKCGTAVDIEKKLRAEENIDVSANTIRRALTRHGLRARVKRKKPLLSKKHRQARFAWAKKYRNWSINDWKKVIWSDESKFQLFGSDGREYCWKYDGKPLRNAHVKPTVKFGGGNIMVWGCFTWEGVGYLTRMDERMNAELYRQILADELLQTIRYYRWRKSDIIFQHDNDRKHTSGLVSRWLTEVKIPVLD